jgi:glyoxylase-like metal-dependent hydrolase (beta-lactamase superfamily II)
MTKRESRSFRIGDLQVSRIDELTLDAFQVDHLYPQVDPTVLQRHGHRLGPGSCSVEAGTCAVSIHTWLVRTPHHTILIDTSSGNDKPRPTIPVLDHLNEPYLQRLAAAGVRPEDVDYVLLTHLHSDHVGWNTRLADGQWVPTFPRARYVMSGIERVYSQSHAEGKQPEGEGRPGPHLGPCTGGTPVSGVYDDSVRPVIDAGMAEFIKVDGSEFLDGISFLPTPGHSIDHASIRIVSRGEEALFAGDVMHHPLQVYEPGMNTCFCEFPEAAVRSRIWALNHAAERKALFFSTHFAESSAGYVSRTGDRFDWRFA